MSNGKGDTQRPVDRKKFDRNYAAIRWASANKSRPKRPRKARL